MKRTSVTVMALCGTLLWVGTVHAFPKPPPLTCSQRQTQAVEGLTDLLDLGQALCMADLTSQDCDANVCSPEAEAFPATGQTTVYAVGVDDGAIKAGAPLSYTDNGDGTITDNNTKLMWEKKDQASGGLHNWANTYPWAGTCSSSGNPCGTAADCLSSGAGQTCDATDDQGTGYTIFQWAAALNTAAFARHTDWRVPNVKELESIEDFQNFNPSVATAFNASCGSGCTVTSCSCTQVGYYWSATTVPGDPGGAWGVGFYDGGLDSGSKPGGLYVRAVRSGL